MSKIILVPIFFFFFSCASKSLNPYLDEYKELKEEYESGLINCQDYFKGMKALLKPVSTGEVREENDNIATDEESESFRLIDDKQKVFQFIKYNQYPIQVVQNGHNFNSYIFKPYVQESDEFDLIYEDYTNKENIGEGGSCEESGTILNFYSALIPNLETDFKSLIEKNSFIFTIKHYINSKKFMTNEPLISALVDLKILELLTEHKYTKISPKNISKVLNYIEKKQGKIQEDLKVDLGSDSEVDLEKLTEEDDPNEVDDIKKLNHAHRAEIKLAQLVRKKINKLMKKF